jgi:hypothetical protein
VPIVGHQVHAVDELLRTARDLSTTASAAAGVVDPDDLRPKGGRVDLTKIDALASPLDRLADALQRARVVAGGARSPWLVGKIDEQIDQLLDRSVDAATQVRTARASVAFVPDLLGAHGPRTWLLLLTTPSELRGAGGFPGNYGILRTDDGRLVLDHVGRIGEMQELVTAAGTPAMGPSEYLARYGDVYDLDAYVQNVTASPDFPSDAEAVALRYGAATNEHIDGVISLDPYAFATLLSLTGPISVPEWPVPLTSANAAQVLLYDQYVGLGTDARIDLLSAVTEALFARITDGGLPDPATSAPALAEAVAQKHIQLWSSRRDEEGWFDDLGATGALGPVRGDALAVVVNSANETKIDWFLHRAVDYRPVIDPVTGAVEATLDVTFANDAPASGLPAYIIGPAGPYSAPAGSNRAFVSVFSPLDVVGATVDGVDVVVSTTQERGRNVHETFVTIGPASTAVLHLRLAGKVALPGGDYVLDIGHQPGVRDDRVAVAIGASGAWRADADDVAYAADRPRRLVARFEPT